MPMIPEEGLSVRTRKRKRVSRAERLPLQAPAGPDQLWCLDFMQDALSWGRKFRLLTVEDVFTREALAIEVDTSLSGVRVARVLDRVIGEHGGRPQEIVLDNGPELTSRLRDECLNEHWFLSLPHARRVVEDWRRDYNLNRPHSSLGNLTPEEFRLDHTKRLVAAGL